MHKDESENVETPSAVGVSVLARVAWVVLGLLIISALAAISIWLAGRA
ncbi:hypothetical protein ABIE56_002370 [Luteibacter sp. 621]|jgi:hypothetical protein